MTQGSGVIAKRWRKVTQGSRVIAKKWRSGAMQGSQAFFENLDQNFMCFLGDLDALFKKIFPLGNLYLVEKLIPNYRGHCQKVAKSDTGVGG